VNRYAKIAIGRTLRRTGLWERMLRTWARRRIPLILTYHRVIEKLDETLDYSQPGMVVAVSTFDRQLAVLKRHFQMVSLDAVLADGDDAPARPRCAITFDDGWRDNYEQALPILEKHRIPATIFLATDFIGTDRAFWHTQLIHALVHGDASRLAGHEATLTTLPASVRGALNRLVALGRALAARDLDELIETLKVSCDEEVIELAVRAVGRAMGVQEQAVPGRRFFLDWGQVSEMAAAGVVIASHGCSHRIMTRLSLHDVREEMTRSRVEIERRTGRPAEHFAFPNEAASAALLSLAQSAGYRTVCAGGLAPPAGHAGIQSLRRLGMHEGVSSDGRSFNESMLHYWLFKAGRR
jgi:peptidoglycan/xylan/chitin deacetylase (PgdA/CDA1 family)